MGSNFHSVNFLVHYYIQTAGMRILRPEGKFTLLMQLYSQPFCYSIDEATVDGTTEVYFNRPVAFYVDNYLNFPVGTAVPVGE